MHSELRLSTRDKPNVLRSDLLTELLARHDKDQKARAALLAGRSEMYEQLLHIDVDNAVWLETVIDRVGWPGYAIVGEEGAHAAWMLAQHADRRPSFQQRCQHLMEEAVSAGDASPADLAHLTDRVLLAQGKDQIYGTQTSARDGRFIACRLRDSDRIDELRAAVGLEPLEIYLRHVLEQYGTPSPATVRCRACGQQNDVWLPEIGGRVIMKCSSCGTSAAICAHFPGG
jgi:hypothetical protein